MDKQLVRILWLFLCAPPVWGAACTASSAGNWSAAATWGGTCGGRGTNGTPGIGDTATINAAVTWDSAASNIVGINGAAPATMYLESIPGGGGSGYANGLSGAASMSLSGGTVAYSATGFGAAAVDADVINGAVTPLIYHRGTYTVCPTSFTINASDGTGATLTGTPTCSSTGTAAISFGSGGSLTIATGVTAYVRGTIVANSGSSTVLTLNPGSNLNMDMSQAAGAIYRIEIQRAIVANCTASQPCSIQGYGGTTSIIFANGYATVTVAHTTFKNVGDANQYAMQAAGNGSSITYSIFDTSGLVFASGTADGGAFTFSSNLARDTPIQNPLKDRINLAPRTTSTMTTGTRNITGNTLDGAIDTPVNSSAAGIVGFTITGNYIGGMGTGAGWASWTNNYLRGHAAWTLGTPSPASGTAYSGNMSYTYVHLDSPLWLNPHALQVATNWNVSNSIFGQAGRNIGDSGEWLGAGASSSYGTLTFTNNIFLCDSTGVGSSELGSFRGSGGTSANFVLTGNTFCGGYTVGGQYGLVDTNESTLTTAGTITMRNNLAYSLAPSTSLKLWSYGNAAGTQDVCASTGPGGASNCDYNASYNYGSTAPSCTGCTNQGRGYSGLWSVAAGTPGGPGAHDVDGQNPNFVDTGIWLNHGRKVENFDRNYLGPKGYITSGEANPPAWSSSGTYALDDLVSNADTGTYNNETLNFHCWNPAGCTGAPAPGRETASVSGPSGATSAMVSIPAAANLTSITQKNLWCSNAGGQFAITSYSSSGSPIASVTINFSATASAFTCWVVSNWRDYWEWAGDYRVRTDLYNGTTFNDPGIGCSGCTVVQTLNNWITAGLAPQNAAFLGTGYSGANIGAATPQPTRPAALPTPAPILW